VDQEFSYEKAVRECRFPIKFIRHQRDLFYSVDENRLVAIKKPRKAGFTTAAVHLMLTGLLKKPGFKGLYIAPTHGHYEDVLKLIASIIPEPIAEIHKDKVKHLMDDSEIEVIDGYRFAKADSKYDMVVVDEYAWQQNDPFSGYTYYGSIANSILEIIQINSDKVIVGSTPGPTKEKGGVLNKFYSLWVHENEYVKTSWERHHNDLLKDIPVNWNDDNLNFGDVFGIFNDQPKDKWPQRSKDAVSLERRDDEFKLSFRSECGSTLSKVLSLDQMYQITIKFNNLISAERRSIQELEFFIENQTPDEPNSGRALEKTYDELKWKDNLGCKEAKDFRAKIVKPLEVEENWVK
jgi:hypothetical protein